MKSSEHSERHCERASNTCGADAERGWLHRSLRQDSSGWVGARAPVWWVLGGKKLSLTSCRRTGRGQEIRPQQVWFACVSHHSCGALLLKTIELSRCGKTSSQNYVVKSRGKPTVFCVPWGRGSLYGKMLKVLWWRYFEKRVFWTFPGQFGKEEIFL